ncbi:hypothetical protein [Pantoea ananatis]|uniref:hypothetical protein n=1 Tax=Pantoea ananas TaxID=553 RepID=UPI001EE6232E|nr:hypothetical protein [Pantoea ananatis]PKC45540.1 hypothetical protein V461_05930 [Pantoea ananatis BRT98]
MVASDDDKKEFTSLTVRHVPVSIDVLITQQAAAMKRSKSDLLQELLTDVFDDPVGHFIRTSPFVALMDGEVAKLTGARVSDHWFRWHTPAENRQWWRILGIQNADELQEILMRGAAPELLVCRARQYGDQDVIPRGISLHFALFTEAARRDDPSVLRNLHRAVYYGISEEALLSQAGELREIMRLPALEGK